MWFIRSKAQSIKLLPLDGRRHNGLHLRILWCGTGTLTQTGRSRDAVRHVEDTRGRLDADDGIGIVLIVGEVAVRSGLKDDDHATRAVANSPAHERREETFHCVQTRHRGRPQVDAPSRIPSQSCTSFGVLAVGVVVKQDMDDPIGWRVGVDHVPKIAGSLVRITLLASVSDPPSQQLPGGERGPHSAALPVVSSGRAFVRLHRPIPIVADRRHLHAVREPHDHAGNQHHFFIPVLRQAPFNFKFLSLYY